MGKVLIVDDDTNFLLSVQEGLKFYLPETDLLAATTGEEALDVLKKNQVDVVITDLKMPGMSGLELLSEISRNYPRTAVIFITAFGTPKVKSEAQRRGAVKYMEKPIELKSLAEAIKSSLEIVKSGVRIFEKMPLPLVLEVLNIEGANSTVLVEEKGRVGVLYFENGQLINAELEGIEGEKAFMEIAKFDTPKFRITALRETSRKITKTIEELIQAAENWISIEGKGKEETATNYKEILEKFSQLDSFISAFVLDKEGKIVERIGEKVEVDGIKSFIQNAELLNNIFPGGMEMMSFEDRERILLLNNMGNQRWIGLLIGGKGSLGIARHLIRKARVV